jgi:Ca2+-binding RTX toxin-like protein
MAHDYHVKTTGTQAQALETQLSGLINQIWGAGSANSDLVTLGVQHLNAGGAWSDVWLALATHARHKGTLTDAQGNVNIVSNQSLSETGWSLLAGDNTLEGGAGNDVLVGGGGHNTLDGGTGTDLAVFFGTAADFDVALVRNATTGVHEAQLRHKLTGAVNTVRDVELFQFGGQAYSVPVGRPQPAEGVFVELTTYMEPVSKVTLQGVGFHPEWIV